MIIEYSNAIPPKGRSAISVVIVLASCAFFFIPTTLIVLGYLSSRPTGTLISPLPQGVLSDATPAPTAVPEPTITPVIAAGNDATLSAREVVPQSDSNITSKTATVSAGLAEQVVSDPDIKASSQIYLSPKTGDKSIYSVKSKQDGTMTIMVNTPSDIDRYVDYHIVNP